MGRTIAKHFFHPYEVKENKKKEKLDLKNWEDSNSPFYYDQIPIYLNKVYRSIDIGLKNKCTSKIPDKQCLPQIVVLEDFLQDLKNHIKKSKIYESVKYNIKYEEELPCLLDLVKSHKYFMYYLHIPEEKYGFWFCEGRFFTLEEIEKTRDEGTFHKIEEFVKSKKIDYMDFLEEWVGLIFHLSAEFLLFKKKVKVIFYSCENCYRPGLFIKEQIKKEEDDSEKIWGTINIVDTIIYNCTTDLNYSIISKEKKRSKNNIIFYDETFNDNAIEESKDWELIKDETDGAFILTMKESELDNLIDEIKRDGNKYKFDLIITSSNAELIINKFEALLNNNSIDRICIYKIIPQNLEELRSKYNKIDGVCNQIKEVISFVYEKKQESEIFPTIQLITYKDYINKYMAIHKLISEQYGNNSENCLKIAISYLKDFLFWCPRLKVESSKANKLNIQTLLETLQKFKGINDNEEDIIRLYTQEKDSYYQDFNNWLNISDPLAIQKTSWFIAGVMYSLNNYAKNKNKGIRENNVKLYRGIRANLYDLLSYERAKGKLICFPSFTSTSRELKVAKDFAYTKTRYQTIITINYKYRRGFKPTAVDVSKIAIKEHEYEKECLFLPYSFFRVKNVKIDNVKKTAEIELDTVGKEKILEKKLREGFKLIENKEGFMEVVKE